MTTITADQAREYLVQDNGWTDQEFDTFLDGMAPWDYPTSTDDWARAAQAFNAAQEEHAANDAAALDAATCYLDGSHHPEAAHPLEACPVEAANEAEAAAEAAFMKRYPGVL